MSTLAELHERWSQDPEYREAREQLGPEYEVAQALIEARTRAGLTQAVLPLGHAFQQFRHFDHQPQHAPALHGSASVTPASFISRS